MGREGKAKVALREGGDRGIEEGREVISLI